MTVANKSISQHRHRETHVSFDVQVTGLFALVGNQIDCGEFRPSGEAVLPAYRFEIEMRGRDAVDGFAHVDHRRVNFL